MILAGSSILDDNLLLLTYIPLHMESRVESATSEHLLDVNWELVIGLTDEVTEGGPMAAKDCMQALRRRLMHKNPKVILLALTVSPPFCFRPPRCSG